MLWNLLKKNKKIESKGNFKIVIKAPQNKDTATSVEIFDEDTGTVLEKHDISELFQEQSKKQLFQPATNEVQEIKQKMVEFESFMKKFGLDKIQQKNIELEKKVSDLQNQIKISQSLLLNLEKNIQALENESVNNYRRKIQAIKEEFLNQANNEM